MKDKKEPQRMLHCTIPNSLFLLLTEKLHRQNMTLIRNGQRPVKSTELLAGLVKEWAEREEKDDPFGIAEEQHSVSMTDPLSEIEDEKEEDVVLPSETVFIETVDGEKTSEDEERETPVPKSQNQATNGKKGAPPPQ